MQTLEQALHSQAIRCALASYHGVADQPTAQTAQLHDALLNALPHRRERTYTVAQLKERALRVEGGIYQVRADLPRLPEGEALADNLARQKQLERVALSGTGAFTLCLIDRQRANHLGGAPRLAGGWIAVADVCRVAVEDETRRPLLLALLPSAWLPDTPALPVSRAAAGRIAAALERSAASPLRVSLPDAAETAADFAVRIREHLAGAVRS